MEDKNKFTDSYEVLQVLAVIVGGFCAYFYKKASYVFFAMAALFLLIGIEALRKEKISLRGKVVTRLEDPGKYFAMICVYLVGGGICLSLAFISIYYFE